MLLALLPVLFPLYLIKGSLFGIPMNVPEIVIVLLFVHFAWKEQIWKLSWWERYPMNFRSVWLVLFVLAAGLSAAIAPEAGQLRALGILKSWVLVPMLYAFMFRLEAHRRPSLIQWAMASLSVGALALSFVALTEVISGQGLAWDGRADGPFDSPNHLSLYLGPVFVYLLMMIGRSKEWLYRGAYVMAMLVIGAALYFTHSYAAWIAVSFALAVGVFLQLYHHSRKHAFGALLGILFLGAGLLATQAGSDKFVQFLDFTGRSSTSVRLEVYEVSLSLIKENPLLGIGLGQYEWVYQEAAPRVLGHAPWEWVMIHPHNIVLSVWLNLGLAGLVSFVWMLRRSLAWLFEKDKHHRPVLALMLLSILAHGMFDTPYFKNDLALQFWLLMAILL